MQSVWKFIAPLAIILVIGAFISGWQKATSRQAVTEAIGALCEVGFGISAIDEDGQRNHDFEAEFERLCRENGW